MEVINYLKSHGVEALKDEFSIRVKEYPEEKLLVLNYCQIDSPKCHPITMECRGLILDYDFNVVSRSFDRFFNHGEALDITGDFDITKAIAYEKLDGSLIKLYYHNGMWHFATRGTAFAETANDQGCVFKDLCWDAFEVSNEIQFQKKMNKLELCGFVDAAMTYIFELTSPRNRIVKRYKTTSLTLLGIRHKDGWYNGGSIMDLVAQAMMVNSPKVYEFDTMEHCLRASRELKELDEGYVMYDRETDQPLIKIKSPAYVAVHHIRGEGIPTPNRIMDLVWTNETDEYLSYFPEDYDLFEPYEQAHRNLVDRVYTTWHSCKGIEDQKEFAMEVKDLPYSGILFSLRNYDLTMEDAVAKMTKQNKRDLLAKYVGLI